MQKRALERAFNIDPGQDWLAVRLARMYRSLGDMTNCKRVLNTCIQNNPSSKYAHLEMGRVLISTNDSNTALDHLQRSFSIGDNHYEAQFLYARELFLHGRIEEANRLFTALNENAPGKFRTLSTAVVELEGTQILYESLVKRKEEGYAFLKLHLFPIDIFASRADSNLAEWDKLNAGAQTKCNLAFNRRGARATSIIMIAR